LIDSKICSYTFELGVFFCYTNMSEFLCYYSLLCKCAKNFNRTLIRMKASIMMMMIVDSQTRHHYCYSCLLSTKINTMIARTFVICFMGIYFLIGNFWIFGIYKFPSCFSNIYNLSPRAIDFSFYYETKEKISCWFNKKSYKKKLL